MEGIEAVTFGIRTEPFGYGAINRSQEWGEDLIADQRSPTRDRDPRITNAITNAITNPREQTRRTRFLETSLTRYPTPALICGSYPEHASIRNENFHEEVTRLRKIASKIAINVLCVRTAVIDSFPQRSRIQATFLIKHICL